MDTLLMGKSDAELASLALAVFGTGYDDPGADMVNGITIERIDAEVTRRGINVYMYRKEGK